jgi:hypothetical protein
MATEQSPTARLSRRKFLAAGTATVTAAVAGCTEGTINWLADKVLEEVNVFNATDSEVTGNITVAGPDGETRLDEEFTLSEADNDDDDNGGIFDDTWTDAGSYEVTVELEDPVNGTETASETVSIEDTGDEMLVVVLGDDELEDDISFRVGDSLTDAWPESED